MPCDPTTNSPAIRAMIHAQRYRESPLGKAEDRLWEAVTGWHEVGSHGPDEVAEAAAKYVLLKRGSADLLRVALNDFEEEHGGAFGDGDADLLDAACALAERLAPAKEGS